MTPSLSLLLSTLLTLGLVGCDDSPGPHIDGDHPVTTAPASAPADLNDPPSVDDVLAAMEAAGRQHGRITATLDYEVDQPMTGDRELRSGRIRYQRQTDQTPPQFYVGFDTLKLGEGATLKDKVEYAFNGQWLTIAKHRIKQMTRYEIAAEGETVEAFRLGKGPFPMPFGQEAAAMKEHFDITTRPSGPADPDNTIYLKLVPREAHQEGLSFVLLEMWIDRDTSLPVRLVSRDASRNTTTVTFADVDTDVTFDAADFHLPRPLGWEYSEQRK